MSMGFDKIHSNEREVHHPAEIGEAANKPSQPEKVEHEFKSLFHITDKKTANSKKADHFAEDYFIHKQKQKEPPPKSITIHDIYPVANTQMPSLEFIAKSAKLFLHHAKAAREAVDLEVKHTRDTKYLDNYWMGLKKAFHARLDDLNQKRQQNL